MKLPDLTSLKSLDKRLLFIPVGLFLVYAATRTTLTPSQKIALYNAETRRQTELARIQKQPELENIRLSSKVALDSAKRKESTEIALANAQSKSVAELAKIDASSQKYATDAQVTISKLMYSTQADATNKQYLLGKYLADTSSNTTKYQTDKAYQLKERELRDKRNENERDFWGGLVTNVADIFF